MKANQAFAAFRASLITDKNHAIINELVPAFNSCCEDIRRRVETDFNTYHNQAKADNLKKSLIYDLILGRKKTLEIVQQSMQKTIDNRLAADEAKLEEKIIVKDGKTKRVLFATFPDGSIARVPYNLYIDYSLFERV